MLNNEKTPNILFLHYAISICCGFRDNENRFPRLPDFRVVLYGDHCRSWLTGITVVRMFGGITPKKLILL